MKDISYVIVPFKLQLHKHNTQLLTTNSVTNSDHATPLQNATVDKIDTLRFYEFLDLLAGYFDSFSTKPAPDPCFSSVL
jgi:hypothetical protein